MKKFNQTDEFLALKAKWYKKLEKSGFVDVEHNMIDTEKFSFSLMRGKSVSSIRNELTNRKQASLHLWSCYALFNTKLSDYERFVATLIAEGATIREISRKAKSRRFKKHSTFTIFSMKKHMNETLISFNETHPDGALYDYDVVVDDVMIKEPVSSDAD